MRIPDNTTAKNTYAVNEYIAFLVAQLSAQSEVSHSTGEINNYKRENIIYNPKLYILYLHR